MYTGRIAEAIEYAQLATGPIAARLLQQAQTLQRSIKAIIEKYPAITMQCDKAARGIHAAFKAVKANPQYIRITDKYGAQNFFDGKGNKFAETGFHYAVKVGDKVFDALTGPQGMNYDKYLKMFEKNCMYPVVQNLDKI